MLSKFVGWINKDDTSYVYSLPFKEGKIFRVAQGYFGHFSYKKRAAFDFNMKRGTEIYAARGGVVVRAKEDGDAAFPHLHFLVWRNDVNGRWQQIATRFKTSKGVKYLSSWERYKIRKTRVIAEL